MWLRSDNLIETLTFTSRCSPRPAIPHINLARVPLVHIQAVAPARVGELVRLWPRPLFLAPLLTLDVLLPTETRPEFFFPVHVFRVKRWPRHLESDQVWLIL